MNLTKAIEIDSKSHEAKVSVGEWKFGPCVEIEVLGDMDVYFKSKVLCSPECKDYERVSSLETNELLEEAWQPFKERYPFDKLKETVEVGLTILVAWQIET